MNILTFDIEEWFHCDVISEYSTWDKYKPRIHESLAPLLNILSEKDQKATFFILGWVANKYPEVIKEIQNENHEIACHSFQHGLVHKMNQHSFKQDTERAIKTIEDLIGKKIIIYRAPAFSITEYTPWAFEVLIEAGIEIDCSIFPSRHDYGGFKSFKESKPVKLEVGGHQLKEFPINTHKFLNRNIVFSGGGFFRIFPYSIISKWTKESDYVMSYFHLRDFDFEQPVLPHLTKMRKFKSYYGLKNALSKFEKWISDFEFNSLMEASKLVNWEKTKIISF